MNLDKDIDTLNMVAELCDYCNKEGCAISIRLKILIIVLGFFSLLAAAFGIYSAITSESYRHMRTAEISKTVAFESERVGKTIAEAERNAIDLALAGYQFYLSGDYSKGLGVSIVIGNFSAFRDAVGGGIWFEPYALREDTERMCYYAFFDPSTGGVRYDPDFQSEEYDYHSQIWYRQIATELEGKDSAVWTVPYYDQSGTLSLMTTVGAGIYDRNGQFVGMATVDWQIRSMLERLSTIRPTENSFVLLASPRDDYIITNTHEPDVSFSGLSLSVLPWYGELNFSGDDSVEEGDFIQDGVEYLSFSRILDNGWLFSIQIPSKELFREIEHRNSQFTAIIGSAFLILLAAAFFLISRLINRPLRKLTTGVAELGRGNLGKQIEIFSKDEIGALALVFNKMTVDLKASIAQSAHEHAEKEHIMAELNVATRIQASMLPCIFPPYPDRSEFDIFASMQPAKEVGGDFYDFFLIGENTLAVVIADVSGKGVPAALFMVIAKTLIKNNAQHGRSPKEVFETVNNLLCENNKEVMFVTAFMGYLDIPSGSFTYVNAGHIPPLIRKGGSYDCLSISPGFVLAGMGGISYRQGGIQLSPGDELLLYTDGVTESVNSRLELFGQSRLLEAANRYSELPLREFAMSIKSELKIFTADAEQADDITMLALRYKGPGKGMKELVVDAAIENLPEVIDFIEAELTKAGCPAKTQTQIAIASEEIFVNIANYAYTPDAGRAVISISVGKEALIVFKDSGKPYNPLEKEDPNITASAEEREIGGLGIFIAKQLMDNVSYRYEDNKNILEMRKLL